MVALMGNGKRMEVFRQATLNTQDYWHTLSLKNNTVKGNLFPFHWKICVGCFFEILTI